MSSPLGALPRLSPASRWALAGCAVLAFGNAIALVVQATALAYALAAVVTWRSGPAEVGNELIVLACAIVARALLGWASEAVSARAAATAKEELRALLLDSALRRGPEWIGQRGPAELTALATKGLDSLDAYFTKYLPALVTAGVVPVLVGGWILISDWISALAVLLTVPLIPLFAWLVGRYTQQRTARAARDTERLSGHLFELIRALPVLTAFGRAKAQGESVRRVSAAHRRSTMSTLRIAFLSALVLELLASLSVALVAVGIGLRLVSGELDLATGLLVLVLAPECYLPLRAVGAAHHASEDGLEAVRRVDELVCSARYFSGQRASDQEISGSWSSSAELQVERLRVARRDGFTPDGLSFTVRPGEILRLETCGLGPSGSGKSSLFAVLLGFARAESGRISFGGTEIAECGTASWRGAVAWVPQRPVFTGATVADELELAVSDQPECTVASTQSVLESVAAGHLAHRRIDQLSTGERQRVAVARALLRMHGGARILLLDEPTAHLDQATAATVHAAIEDAAETGAIVVLASHRPVLETAETVRTSPELQQGDTDFPAIPGRIRDLITARGVLGACLGALSLLSGLALTALSAWLIARASQHPPLLTLTTAIVGVRAFALSRSALRYVERLLTHDAAFRLAGGLRRRLWDALVALGPLRCAGLRRGDGVARLAGDADAMRDLVPRVLAPPLIAALVAAGAVAIETAVLPEAGVLFAASLLIAGIAGPAVALAAERHAASALAEGRRRVADKVLNLLDASAELLAFGAHTSRRAELATADDQLAGRARRVSVAAGAAQAVMTVTLGAAVIGGAWFGARAVSGGHLAPELVPLLALVPLAAAEAVAPLPQAAQQWRALREAQARVTGVLAAEAGPARTPERSEGGFALGDVDARWPTAAEPALRGASVRVPEGAHVAVVGPSGGGKSTLVATLLGFLPPERGQLRVPEKVTWCPQEPQLVSTTIRENLRLADPQVSDRRLGEALRLAGLPGWSAHLDEVVGTGGMALSGGQAQRLALARALLREDADLVLLDEPTAHLDAETADVVMRGLRRALRGVTVVHVTHRPEEAECADFVLRVQDGELSVVDETAPCGPLPSQAARFRANLPQRAGG